MMRAFLAAMLFFSAAAAPAVAEGGEKIAQLIGDALAGPEPDHALLNVFYNLDDHTGGFTVATFVQDPKTAARRDQAVLTGDCELFRRLELGAFYARYPQVRAAAMRLRDQTVAAYTVASVTDGSMICNVNRRIFDAVAGRDSLEHLGFPLLAGALLKPDPARPRISSSSLTVHEIAGRLGYLWDHGAVCRNNRDAIASLLRFTHTPRLIEFPPAQAHYLFVRARTHGLDPAAARRASPLHRATSLDMAERARIKAAASDDRPWHQHEHTLPLERGCHETD